MALAQSRSLEQSFENEFAPIALHLRRPSECRHQVGRVLRELFVEHLELAELHSQLRAAGNSLFLNLLDLRLELSYDLLPEGIEQLADIVLILLGEPS